MNEQVILFFSALGGGLLVLVGLLLQGRRVSGIYRSPIFGLGAILTATVSGVGALLLRIDNAFLAFLMGVSSTIVLVSMVRTSPARLSQGELALQAELVEVEKF